MKTSCFHKKPSRIASLGIRVQLNRSWNVTHMNELCHTYEWVISHPESHDFFQTTFVKSCDSKSVWKDFIRSQDQVCWSWLVLAPYEVFSYTFRVTLGLEASTSKWTTIANLPMCKYIHIDSFLCETWLIPMWDMTQFYVRHDSFVLGNCQCANVYVLGKCGPFWSRGSYSRRWK